MRCVSSDGEQVSVLKRKMPEATVGRKKMKEFLVRMIYVEMLGHDASFGYIKVRSPSQRYRVQSSSAGYLPGGHTEWIDRSTPPPPSTPSFSCGAT